MKKEKLIEELQKLPDNTEVCLFDYKKNMDNDAGDGSSSGIYPDFEVTMLTLEDVAKGHDLFAILSFDNDDYDDNE